MQYYLEGGPDVLPFDYCTRAVTEAPTPRILVSTVSFHIGAICQKQERIRVTPLL